jgi:uncharacterized protein (TIGR02099 family)
VNGSAGRGSARAWRLLAATLAGVLITAALLLGLLRFGLALLPGQAAQLQQWVEQQTHLRVEFDGIDARLRWFGPEVVLRAVRVLDEAGGEALFAAHEGTVALDLWSLFRTGELVAGRVRIVGPTVTLVRLADGRVRLLGLGERPEDRPPFDLDRLPAGRVEIESATVHYRDLKTGRGPWTLDDLRVSLRRGHDDVEMSGSGRLPAQLGSRLEFAGRVRGSLERLAGVDARLSLAGERVLLAGLADFLPPAAGQPISGSGPLAVVLRVVRGRLELLRVDFDLADVVVELPLREIPPVQTVEISRPYRPPGASTLSMPQADKAFVGRPVAPTQRDARYATLAGRVRLRREGEAIAFRAGELRIRRADGEPLAQPEISGTWRGHPASAFEVDLYASRLDAATLWPLLLATAPAGFDRWAGLDPAGQVAELRASVRRERAGSEPDFAASAELVELSARPIGRWPGFSGLTATVSGTDERGRLALRAVAPAFTWPRMFREPIELGRADVDVEWGRDGPDWIIDVPQFALEHAQGAARGRLDLRLDPRLRSPVLNLEAQVARLDAGLVPRVLPVGRLKPRTIVWLENAFRGGRASNGRVSYRGPVRRFPFRGGEGEFVAVADVDAVQLDYFGGFAPLAGGAGRIEFRNAGLQATLTAGNVGGLRLAGAKLAIADLKQPLLEIDAQASGDLAKALSTLQGSPLGPRLGAQFMQLTGRGPADYDLRLRLPTADARGREYAVRAVLRSVSLAWPALRAPATGIQGTLEVRNDEIRGEGLRGTILGGPFEASVRPGPVASGAAANFVVSGSGRAAGAVLPRFIGLPDSIRMSGTTDWRLEGRLERRRAGEPWPARFAVTSDLGGLAIDAPLPFAKRAAELRPTRVVLAFEPVQRSEVRIDSGSARAIGAFAGREGRRWEFERGAVRFDGQPVALPGRPGLHVAGDWPEFDLGEWLRLRTTPGGGRRLSDWLGPVDVHLDRARVLGFEFADVTARLQADDHAWRVDVDGPMADGRVTVPLDLDGDRPIGVDLGRLTLRAARERPAATDGAATDPRRLPAIDLRAADFVWEGRRFGRLQAGLQRDPAGLRLADLRTQSGDFELTGSGSWLAEGSGSRTRIALEFASTDLAAASRALGYRDAVDARQARASANLTWSGGPAADVIARMEGTVRLELDDGQLRGVKPGAGRVLGLISVVELPRRLALDFRDVTGEGLSFDTVRGDFEIQAGNAHTQNLLLKGATVDIGVVGRTGLATQDYEQTIVVSGSPSGPITVAGALAGGPVGAAGALLFSQLFKGQLQGLARVYYRVTGPWSNPSVERISGSAGTQTATGSAAQEQSRP